MTNLCGREGHIKNSKVHFKMKVCIVGAGVAGLQVADALTGDGHECHVFEREDSVGGVWRKNYVGYALQVPMQLYEFPGMPRPEAEGTFPDGSEVMAYIEEFVRQRDLPRRCTFHLNEAVLGVKHANGAWVVTTSEGPYTFEYCVICTGMYDTPNVPSFPGVPDDATIHSSRFTDASRVIDKKVVVVGAGKSAIDCAVAASKCASSVTLLSRKLHWPVPRHIAGLVPFQWGTYSRVGHFLLPPHWDLSSTERRLHGCFGWLKWLVWRTLEWTFTLQFRMEKRPSTPLDVDLFYGGQVVTTEFRDAVEARTISMQKYTDTHPALAEADVVISATGFRKDYTMFDDDTRSRLDVQQDGLWLYRNIVPARVRRLAFIGSEVSTFNNLLTQHVQARWLCHVLRDGGIPDVPVMCSEVERDRTWKRSWMPESTSRAALVQLHMTK